MYIEMVKWETTKSEQCDSFQLGKHNTTIRVQLLLLEMKLYYSYVFCLQYSS